MPTSGPVLRRERRAKDITVVDLAARLRISRQSLWALERAAVVETQRAEEYRQAVKAISDAKTEEGEAA